MSDTKENDMNTIITEILDFVKSKLVTSYDNKYTTFIDLRKIFTYLYEQDNKVFPIEDPKKLYLAFRKYPLWTNYIIDLETNYPKVAFEICNKEIKNKALEWWKINKSIKKITKTELMSKEVFNEIPAIFIPENKITFKDKNMDIKRYDTMIDRTTKDCLCVIMASGGGKTVESTRYASQLDDEMNGKLPLLLPSFRIALVTKQFDDFKSLKVEHYSDIKDHLIYINEKNKLVCQIDSIHRVMGEMQDGLLILDEIESTIQHIFSSPYIKNPNKIIKKLTFFIKNAKTVLILDANLSETTINYLQDICELSVKIYRNTFIRHERPIFFLQGKGAMIKRIIDDLKAGKNVFVPTNSSKFGDYLVSRLQEEFPNGEVSFKKYDKTLKINKENGDPIKDTLNYRCAIITPKFQAGNSVTDKHFHKVYGYFTGASCLADGASQLLMRVRAIEDPAIYLYVDNRLGPGRKALYNIKSFHDMKIHMLTKEFIRHSQNEHILSNGDIHYFKFDSIGTIDLKDPTTYLFIANKYRENESYKNYTKCLISYLKGMGGVWGGNIIDESPEAFALEKATTKAISTFGKSLEIKEAESIAQAKSISTEEANVIKRNLFNRIQVTEDEQLALEKFNFNAKIKLLNPDKAESYILGNKVKYSHTVMQKLSRELVSVKNIEDEKISINRVINDIAKIQPCDPKQLTTVETQFYKLDNCDKALSILYLITILRLLGFIKTIFDVSKIHLKKEETLNFILKNKDSISTIFNTNLTGNNIKPEGIISWFNKRLVFLSIKITAVTKKKDSYYFLDSPWRIVLNENKTEFSIKHYPLEVDIPFEQYRLIYIETLKMVTEIQSTRLVITNFDQCYGPAEYPDSYQIIDRDIWNTTIKSKIGDDSFMRMVSIIYNGYLRYNEFIKYIDDGGDSSWENYNFNIPKIESFLIEVKNDSIEDIPKRKFIPIYETQRILINKQILSHNELKDNSQIMNNIDVKVLPENNLLSNMKLSNIPNVKEILNPPIFDKNLTNIEIPPIPEILFPNTTIRKRISDVKIDISI